MTNPPSPSRRRGGIIIPTLLILLGVAFLLANLGLLPEGWWRGLWRLWPLLLVLIGLEILFGRRWWGAMASVAAVLVLAGAGLAYLYAQGYIARPGATTDHWEVELAGLNSARLEVDFGAGNLYLEGLPSSSSRLIEADFQGLYGPLNKDFESSGGQGVAKLSQRDGFSWAGEPQEWHLRVSPRLSLELRVKAGAAQVELDLSRLAVKRLILELGAATGTVRFPREAGTTTATIKAGASSLTLDIPAGVAARIRPVLGLATLDIDEERFLRRGDYYVSPDFETAAQRLEVSIEGGASTITIR